MTDGDTLKKLDILIYTTAKLSRIYEDGIKAVLGEIDGYADDKTKEIENALTVAKNEMEVVNAKLLETIKQADEIKAEIVNLAEDFNSQIQSLINREFNSGKELIKLIEERKKHLKRRVYG